MPQPSPQDSPERSASVIDFTAARIERRRQTGISDLRSTAHRLGGFAFAAINEKLEVLSAHRDLGIIADDSSKLYTATMPPRPILNPRQQRQLAIEQDIELWTHEAPAPGMTPRARRASRLGVMLDMEITTLLTEDDEPLYGVQIAYASVPFSRKSDARQIMMPDNINNVLAVNGDGTPHGEADRDDEGDPTAMSDDRRLGLILVINSFVELLDSPVAPLRPVTDPV